MLVFAPIINMTKNRLMSRVVFWFFFTQICPFYIMNSAVGLKIHLLVRTRISVLPLVFVFLLDFVKAFQSTVGTGQHRFEVQNPLPLFTDDYFILLLRLFIFIHSKIIFYSNRKYCFVSIFEYFWSENFSKKNMQLSSEAFPLSQNLPMSTRLRTADLLTCIIHVCGVTEGSY